MQRKGVIGMPLPGGRLPRRTAIDGKWLIASSARPFPHVQGNRMQGSGGATPGQRRTSLFVLSSLRTEIMRALENRRAPCRGAGRPPIPLHMRLGRGRSNRSSTPTHHFPIHRCSTPVLAYPRAIARAGSRAIAPGAKMGEGKWITLVSGKV